MRRIAVLLASVAAVAAVAGPSTASIPSPVRVSTTGSCGTDYVEVVRAGNVVVCRYDYSMPNVRPTTTGCNAGETGYLVDGRYGVCVS